MALSRPCWTPRVGCKGPNTNVVLVTAISCVARKIVVLELALAPSFLLWRKDQKGDIMSQRLAGRIALITGGSRNWTCDGKAVRQRGRIGPRPRRRKPRSRIRKLRGDQSKLDWYIGSRYRSPVLDCRVVFGEMSCPLERGEAPFLLKISCPGSIRCCGGRPVRLEKERRLRRREDRWSSGSCMSI